MGERADSSRLVLPTHRRASVPFASEKDGGTNQVALVTRGILSSSGIVFSSKGMTESSPASSYHSASRQYASSPVLIAGTHPAHGPGPK